MDQFGNAGFKGVSKQRSDVTSLTSKNVITQKLRVDQQSLLGGAVTVASGGLTVTGNTLLNNNLSVNGNTRLGNAGSDTVGFYTTAGSAQQTTGVASAVVVSGASGDAITVTTFDGYTVAQVVKSLRNVGLLA
jgi:hypothetical protein